MEKLRISTALQISAKAEAIFKAIIDPELMKNYFITNGSAPMEEGETVYWEFPEFPGAFPVRVKEVIENRIIKFEWDGDTHPLYVEIRLEPSLEGEATVVYVEESEMDLNPEGIKWLKGNTAGWANFLACLKAYIEHGINLRKGGFDFMRQQNPEN